jgi:TP901 family phage tail tape measure protein
MSENLGNIYYTVSADVTSLEGAHKKIDGSIDRTESKLSKISTAIAGVIAGGALVQFLNDAAKAAMNFNASISNLSAITGAVGKDLQFLRDTALEFGATTTLSASQAAEALKLVASAKPDLLESGTALKEVTKQAILLAEAAGIDLATAASTVGKSLNQFGADASEAARFVNVLAAGSKFGSAEIPAISEALKSAGVAAASAKISFEETGSAIQVLATVGLQGSEAGTALRNIFLKLNNDVNKNLRPSVVGLSQALKNVNKLNEDGAAQVKRFGLENIVAAQTLLSSTAKMEDLTKKLTGTNTAFDQARTNTDNLAGDMKAFGSVVEALQIKIGSLADGEMRVLAQSLTGMLSAINGNEAALKEWGGVLDVTTKAGEALAVVIAAKLTSALVGVVSTMIAAQVQSVRYQATLASMAGVSRGAAVATSILAGSVAGLNAALALIGGPVGLIFVVVAGMAALLAQSKTTSDGMEVFTKKTNEAKDALKGLTEAQRNLKLTDIETDLAATSSGLAALKKNADDAFNRFNQQLATGKDSGLVILQQQAEDAAKKVNEAEDRIIDLAAQSTAIRSLGVEVKAVAVASNEIIPPTGGIGEASAEIKKITELLADERKQLTMTADGFEQYALRKKLATAGASETVIAANIAELKSLQALRAETALMEQVDADTQTQKLKVQTDYEQTGKQITADLETPAQKAERELAERLEVIRLYNGLETTAEAEKTAIGLEAHKAYAKQMAEIDKDIAEKKQQTNMQTLGHVGDFFGNMAEIAKAGGKKQFAIYKIAASAQAGISAAMAIMSVLADQTVPFWLKPAAVGTMAAMAGVQIAQINSQSYGGGKLYGGSVQSGTMYPVNENGAPELFQSGNKQYLMPNSKGEVISNKDATGSGGGGSMVTVNVINQSSNTSVTEKRSMSSDRGEIIDIIVSDINARGKTHRAITNNTTAGNKL